jgi:hypothetical protein
MKEKEKKFSLTLKGVLLNVIDDHSINLVLNAIELHCRRHNYNAVVFADSFSGAFVKVRMKEEE